MRLWQGSIPQLLDVFGDALGDFNDVLRTLNPARELPVECFNDSLDTVIVGDCHGKDLVELLLSNLDAMSLTVNLHEEVHGVLGEVIGATLGNFSIRSSILILVDVLTEVELLAML